MAETIKRAVDIVIPDGGSKRFLRIYDVNSQYENPLFITLHYEIGDLVASAANIAQKADTYHEEKETWAKERFVWLQHLDKATCKNPKNFTNYFKEPSVHTNNVDFGEAVSFTIFVSMIENFSEDELSTFCTLNTGPLQHLSNPWCNSRGVKVFICPGNIPGDTELVFSSLYNAILYDAYEMRISGVFPVTCKNCGKLFFPHSRSDEIYCNHIFRNGKTCKQLGYEMKIKADNIMKEYRRIYKNQNARKQRNSHIPNISDRFDSWKLYAKERLKECQNGEITLDTLVREISGTEWMYESK